MSGGGTCIPLDETYGCVSVHTIAHHKDLLGWISAARKYVSPPVSTETITLEFLGEPFSGSNYLMAEIPIAGSTTAFYTVEARRLSGYDSQIPGEAVLIHQVDTTRTDRVAQVVDIDNNGNANDAAAMWIVGETFSDKENGITISVDAVAANGYVVTIQLDASIANDPFSGRTAINGLSGQTTGKNGAATKETGEPDHAATPGGKSVWWKWSPANSGIVTFDTHGSTFDTVLAVYTGSAVNSLTEVASNDDLTPGVTSELSFTAQAGLEYQIAVDGFNALSGDIILNWEGPSSDLSMTLTDALDPVIAAQPLTYTLQVANNGPGMARNVTVNDILPVGVNFVAASGLGWTCTSSLNQVNCTRTTLAPGSAPDILITLTTPPEGGVLTNTATVVSDTADPTPANNNATETTTVSASADLSMVLTEGSDPVFIGNPLENSMTLVNQGPSSASGVVLSSPLESGLLFVSATASQGTCRELNQTITCLVGSLTAGQSATIDIVVTATRSGSLTRTAQVTAVESDPDSANNNASEVTQIDTLPFSLGLAYGPFRDGQRPETGVFPSLAEINEDVQQMSFWTTLIRSYSVLNGFDQIVLKAGLEGMKTLPGAAIGHGNPLDDENEITTLIALANNNSNVVGAIVGNEVLTQSLQMTKEDLIARITRVKDAVSIPVTTCEGPDVWKNPLNNDLAAAVEFICVNIHPWWAGVDAVNAGFHLMTTYNAVKTAYPGIVGHYWRNRLADGRNASGCCRCFVCESESCPGEYGL